VNVPLVDPDGTATDAGTDNDVAALLVSEMVAPLLPADFESVTPHAIEPDAGRLPLPHCSPEICIAVASEKFTLPVVPLRLALAVAC